MICHLPLTVHALDHYWSYQCAGLRVQGSAPDGLPTPPVPPAFSQRCTTRSPSFRCSFLGARWSIKTIFLMFVLFTPVLEHRWMSTPRRVVATGRIILFKARLYACSNDPPPRPLWCMRCAPLQSVWHSKWLWEHRRALLMRFHQCIIWMSFSYWLLT